MENTVKQRLIKYLEYKNISKSAFGKSIGASNAYVTSIRKSIDDDKIKSIALIYPDLNKDWLLYNEGEMLNPETEKNYELIPLMNVDGVCSPKRRNEIADESEYTVRLVAVDGAKNGDKCIMATGDSMEPTIPAGSLVAIREVEKWREFFGFGNIFLLVLNDGRRMIKEVTRCDANPKEYVICVSHNKNHPDEELKKDFIDSVWKVIKILTDKGW